MNYFRFEKGVRHKTVVSFFDSTPIRPRFSSSLVRVICTRNPTQTNKAQWPPSRESAWPTRRPAATSPSAETSPSRRRMPRRSTPLVRGCWRCSSSWCAAPQSSRSSNRSALRNVLRALAGVRECPGGASCESPLHIRTHIHKTKQKYGTSNKNTHAHNKQPNNSSTTREVLFSTFPYWVDWGTSISGALFRCICFHFPEAARGMKPCHLLNALKSTHLSRLLAAFRHTDRQHPQRHDCREQTLFLFDRLPTHCERV